VINYLGAGIGRVFYPSGNGTMVGNLNSEQPKAYTCHQQNCGGFSNSDRAGSIALGNGVMQ